MLKIKIFTLTAMLLCMHVVHTYAQGEGNIWYFGQNAGLDFNGGPPVALGNSQMNTLEGCATISDGSGSLLFYTDGSTVWNASHTIMTNGTGLLGNLSSTQSAVIVPKPNSANIYYIFTVPAGCWTGGSVGLRYSEVDMSLSGGLGAVTTLKNILLSASTCEKITAVKHANGVDFWVLCQTTGVNINTFEVTSAGVNSTPVVSASGALPSTFNYMKASPDGQWVARAGSSFGGALRLMSFDNATGQITGSFPLPFTASSYGCDFSASSSRLYFAGIGSTGIVQYDLTLGSNAAIAASGTMVGTFSFGSNGYAMQLAPDGKIYVVNSYSSFVSVISAPDSLGTACNYVPNAVTLATGTTGLLGLPTFIQSIFLPVTFSVSDTCESDSTLLVASNPNIDSIFWNFGDTASGANNFASGDSVYHVFSSPGTYQASIITYYTNSNGFFGFVDSLFDTIQVTIHPLPFIDLGNDSVLCEGDSLTLENSNTVLNMTYLWSDSSTAEFLPILQADTYYVEVSTLCGTAYDTLVIDSVLPAIVNLGPDSILCVGDTVTFEIEVAQGNYLWQDSDTGSVYHATTTGQYAVTATGLCNTSIDTVNLYFVDPPTTNFPPDTTFCNGQSIDLKAYADSALFLWNDGSIDTVLTASSNDTFRITSTNACGVFEDSVIITIDFPLTVDLGPDTVLCVGSSYYLQANLLGENQYIWQDSSNLDSALVAASGTYWLEATNTCGSYNDSIEVDFEVPPSLELPERFQLCNGAAFTVDATFSRSTYLWNTGSAAASITIVSDGLYKVTATNLCGSAEDSVLAIFDFPLDVNIGKVFELCEGDSLTLDATAPNQPQYNWNNGSQDSVFIVTQQGFYNVTVTNTCGSYSDEVAVYMERKPKTELPSDTLLCEGEVWEVVLSQLSSGYQWQDGSLETRYSINAPGIYTLSRSNDCGRRIDTMEVVYAPVPELELGADTLVCESIAPLILKAQEQDGVVFEWQDKSSESSIVVSESGVYRVMATNTATGCVSQDEVSVSECPIAIWIPSAFTPNADGNNEVFIPQLSYVTDYELKIFNRWGEQIFTTINPTVGWDGRIQGTLVPGGNYVYLLKFKTEKLGTQSLQGTVMLVR